MSSIQEWGNVLMATVGIFAIFGGGIFAALSIFDKGRKERALALKEQDKEADAIVDRVVSKLKEELAIQGTKLDRLEIELKEVRDVNTRVISENKTLREILQGRDESTIKYQARGVLAMDKIDVIYDSLHQLLDALKNFTEKETEIKKTEKTETVTTIHPKPTENGPVSS